MERTDKRLRICGFLILLNLAFIWGNSLLPGELSGALSKWLRDLLALLFAKDPSDSQGGHGLLRKLAHFTEFACLGGLLTWRFSMLKKPVLLALLWGFLVAGADETIQRFVPGRGPGFLDVMIDTAGVLAGIGLLLAGYAIYKKTAKQSLEDRKREKMDGIPSGNHGSTDHDCLQEEENGTAERNYGSNCQ